MTLRPGIKFQDGEPLNAAAVVLQLNKNKASVLVGQAYGPFKSATAVDDLTVRIDMSTPWSAFPAALTGQGGYLAAPKQLNATGKAATDSPIGTGPYSFKNWVRDDHLTVVKNPSYWRKGLPLLDQITFKVIVDPQSRLNSLQAGQLDYEYDNTAANIVQAANDKKLTVIQQDLDQPTMVMLNTAVAPLERSPRASGAGPRHQRAAAHQHRRPGHAQAGRRPVPARLAVVRTQRLPPEARPGQGEVTDRCVQERAPHLR